MSRTSAPVHDGACPAVSAAAPLSVGFGQRIPFILLFKESEICVMRFSRPCAFPSDFAFLCPVRPRLFPRRGTGWMKAGRFSASTGTARLPSSSPHEGSAGRFGLSWSREGDSIVFRSTLSPCAPVDQARMKITETDTDHARRARRGRQGMALEQGPGGHGKAS